MYIKISLEYCQYIIDNYFQLIKITKYESMDEMAIAVSVIAPIVLIIITEAPILT